MPRAKVKETIFVFQSRTKRKDLRTVGSKMRAPSRAKTFLGKLKANIMQPQKFGILMPFENKSTRKYTRAIKRAQKEIVEDYKYPHVPADVMTQRIPKEVVSKYRVIMKNQKKR